MHRPDIHLLSFCTDTLFTSPWQDKNFMGKFFLVRTEKGNIFLKYRHTNQSEVDEPSAWSRTLLLQTFVTLSIKFQLLPKAEGF